MSDERDVEISEAEKNHQGIHGDSQFVKGANWADANPIKPSTLSVRLKSMEKLCSRVDKESQFTLMAVSDLKAKLATAVETINAVQNIIGPYSYGQGTVAQEFNKAWNLNAMFLTDNPELQNAYLDKKKL